MTEETQPQQPPTPAIMATVWQLMEEVQSIAKGGQAPAEAGGYRFRSLEDVLAKIGPAARKYGIAVQSSIVHSEYHTKATDRHTWTWCRLRVRYAFTSLIDGSEFVFESAGEGRDNTDKATSKAMSMALKYGLGQAFLIDLGEPDPDGEKPMDTPQGDVPPREQQRRAQAEASKVPQQREHEQRRQERPQPAKDAAGRARQALSAASNVGSRTELDKIAHQAQQEGLMGEQISGTLLGDRLAAIRETLP